MSREERVILVKGKWGEKREKGEVGRESGQLRALWALCEVN